MAVLTPLLILLRAAIPFVLFLFVACRDERPRVFQSPAPAPSKPQQTPQSPPVPEVPIGTNGPEARILGVSDGASGRPVPMTAIRDSVDILTIVAFGPSARPAGERARVELVVMGVVDTTIVLPLEVPAPVIVAHAFRVPVSEDGRGGLRRGRHTAQVRLVTQGGQTIAESIPLHLEVVGPR